MIDVGSSRPLLVSIADQLTCRWSRALGEVVDEDEAIEQVTLSKGKESTVQDSVQDLVRRGTETGEPKLKRRKRMKGDREEIL